MNFALVLVTSSLALGVSLINAVILIRMQRLKIGYGQNSPKETPVDNKRYEQDLQFEANEWLKFLKSKIDAKDPIQALIAADLATCRHPSNSTIFKEFSQFIASLLENTSGVMRMEMVRIAEAIVARFQYSCSLTDLDMANRTKDLVHAAKNKEIERAAKQVNDSLRAAIESLSTEIEKMEKQQNLPGEDQLMRLAILDKAVDKQLLEQVKDKDLGKKYQALSERFLKISEAVRTAKQKQYVQNVHAYNSKVVESTSQAEGFAKFIPDEEGNDIGERIAPLSRLMGGWKEQLLLPQVALYKNVIQNQIFHKMGPKAKVAFTRQMMDAPEKDVA